ncbi:MAG: hypothetical protein HKN24_07855 [Acidimicrobiales bacterium]|nr:hypothetical protein [Acidimicrobiales bacterium]
MSNRALAVLLTILVAICGFLVWRIWELTRGDLGAAISTPPTTAAADATDAFLTAWSAAQAVDHIAFARVGLAGGGISAFADDIVVQRGDQRLVNRDGSIIYERDGETETCREAGSELFCTPPKPIATVAERAEELRRLVASDQWSYRVRFSPTVGCYELRLDLSRGEVTQNYGLQTDYCFDAATGAVESKIVRRVNRTESYEVSELSGEVRAEKLRDVFPEPILERFFQ